MPRSSCSVLARTFFLALIATVLPTSLHAEAAGKGNPSTDPLWHRLFVFGGGDIGYNYLSTDAPGELSKSGYQFDFKGFFSYSWTDITLDGGAGWLYNDTSKDPATPPVLREQVTTKAPFFRMAGRYRFTPRWELGLLNHVMFGTDTRFQTTEPLENTVNWLLGPEAVYRIPLKFPLAISLAFLTDATISQRQIYQVLLGFTVGFPLQASRVKEEEKPAPVVTAQESAPPAGPQSEPITEIPIPVATAPAIPETSGVRTYSFDLELIEFEFGSAQIRRPSIPMLQELGKFLAEHAGNWTKLTIEGHTDNRGSNDYNLRLSRQRADSVRKILVRQGVKSSSISVEGYGPTRPRDEQNTEEAWRKNRRVDFKLEGINEPKVMDDFFRKLNRKD